MEDYELWLRASKDYKFENISEELLYYRLHDNNISVNHQQAQEKKCIILPPKLFFKIVKFRPINFGLRHDQI